MALKKLDPQQAFDLVSRREGEKQSEKQEPLNIEDGFGAGSEEEGRLVPGWKRRLFVALALIAACMVLVGIGVFYWFVSYHSEPTPVITPPAPKELAIFTEGETKQIIESNLRAFLAAESNEVRAQYVYQAAGTREAMDNYYNGRRMRDLPLWKLERVEAATVLGNELWLVVYRDVQSGRHTVSFQREGDDYLLHWYAMKAYGEMSWEEFIVSRPEESVVMRGYLKHYDGVAPVWASDEAYDFYLIESRNGLFYEVAVMSKDAPGASELRASLQSGMRQAVTVGLSYRTVDGQGKHLMLDSLEYLRWQKLGSDPFHGRPDAR